MVALNNLSNSQKMQHLQLIKEQAEELIITAALHAGVNPDTIDPATHPSPDSYDRDAEYFTQLNVNLAERVEHYNALVAQLATL